jgi:hypothetical protein
MRRLQEGYDANNAITHPQRTGFSPWNPVLQENGNPQWCPQQGERRPKGAATITTDSGGLHPELHHFRRKLSTKDSSPLQLRRLNQEKPNTARDATTTPPAST